MALTNQQVQQVFLAIAGRPAEGSAVAWGASALSVSALANMVVDVRKGADFANSKETFVENLYTQLLGRPSDAEGKEFWLQALNNGASYGDVLAQFINAVLAQPATADIYTLQNKLSIAEKISAQVANFQGGVAAEAQLKDIMSNVNNNTTIENIQDDLNTFEGQYSKATSVTVNQGAEEATQGSEENATTYNATLDYSKEGEIAIEGSTNFGDTLNLKVKGTDDDSAFTLSGVSNVATLNLDLSDAKIKSSTINTNDVAGLKNLTIKGTSADEVTVNTKGVTVDTGAGVDEIKVEVASTIKAGAGDDTIIVNASGATVSVNGGAGKDEVKLGGTDNTADFKKLSLTSVEVLSGKGELSYATLNGKSFKLKDADTDLSVSANGKSGINLSSIKMDGDATSGAITINDVAKGKVTLSADDGIKETIKLTATAKDNNAVTVTGVGSNDVLAASAVVNKTDLTTSVFSELTASSTTNKTAYFLNADGSTVDKAIAALGSKTLASNTDYNVIAFNGTNNKTHIYFVEGDGSTTAFASATFTLIGVVDKAMNGDSITASGDITFA